LKTSHPFAVILMAGSAALMAPGCAAARARPVSSPTAVSLAPRLLLTKFVAYGDSITAGFVQVCPGATSALSARVPASGACLSPERTAPAPPAYPRKLQTLLAERYPMQSISVVNEGVADEEVHAGAENLSRVLTTDAPEVLLLQEGVNTLNTGQTAAIPVIVDTLRAMIREARSRGIMVFVGTLLPQRTGGCRAYDLLDETDDVIAANVQIRTMVGDEGAVLVDLYEAFAGHTAILLGEDGLHPSAAGYQEMAEAFFAAIVRRLEQ
jgi:lysophospholipase L1-like esterase